MASQDEVTMPTTRRPRKSTSGVSPRKAADKENATVDIGSTMLETRKKSRSKSIGPGAADGLRSGTGNRRASLAAPSRPPPRSILKPTIPLLPEIPPHKPKKSAAKQQLGRNDNASNSSDNSGTRIALRTEEEQQAAAREREEKERAALEKEIKDHREARRKSLANRRVSFAAEATLHTFHEIEYLQDSTTSTDSTLRASSIAAPSPAPQLQEHPASDASEAPSTPPEQVEEVVPESPADQRGLHQKKRRRSSGVGQLDFDNTMTSTVYDSDSDNGDGVVVEDNGDTASNSDSDSDEGDGTMVTVDGDELTSASMVSARTASSSNSTLDEVLRQAAHHADSHAEETRRAQPLDEDEELIPAFIGWGKKGASKVSGQGDSATAADAGDEGTEMDMDITLTGGGIIPPSRASLNRDVDEDMSMDVTQAFGGILAQQKPKTAQPPTEEDVTMSEETMEFTMAMGGIRSTGDDDEISFGPDGNEDMSMELTVVMGGVLAGNTGGSGRRNRRRTIKDLDGDDAAMDMTTAVGKILSSEKSGPSEQNGDATTSIDIAKALGGTSNPASPSRTRAAGRKAMEREVDQPTPVSTKVKPEKSPKQARLATASEAETDDSASLAAFKGKGLRRSLPPGTAPAPAPAPVAQSTPSKDVPKSPTRQLNSPKRQASPAGKSPRKSPSKPPPSASKVFQQDPSTGATTPRVVLTPQKNRRLSGIGADRAGLGSPKVAQLFDRRRSIGDVAVEFVPGQLQGKDRKVAFADPRELELEINKDRQDELDKESRRKILEREADGQDATLNLKELIEGLSPKKNPLRGRKSLHVGSAKGVLGKRPAELDEDAEGEEQDGYKRLKGSNASPVRRLTRSRETLETGPGDTVTPTTTTSPAKATTPRSQGRFRNVKSDQAAGVNFNEAPAVNEAGLQRDGDEDPITLQSFLNMTSVRFMDLTTSGKRRHTVAPAAPKDAASGDDQEEDVSLEKRVVAGACTLPMVELYHHSCREAKKYIDEGRSVVRQMEEDVLSENPALFQEYISAAPEFKTLIDNQFKNAKTHARLEGKAMWYEWRQKLQEGMKVGLLATKEGMARDEKLLLKQQKLLDSVLPAMAEHFDALQVEHDDLDAAAKELADSNPAELQAARSELISVDQEIEEKKRKIAALQAELEATESDIVTVKATKQASVEEIKAADKVREECRGWSSEEIIALKARVDALEKKHGWAVSGVQGTNVSVTYLREIELVFDAVPFGQGTANGRIDLWYIAGKREFNAQPLTVEKEFFLQCTRNYLRGLPQAHTRLSRMLGVVRAAWDMAKSVANQARLVNLGFRTTVDKTSDTSIAIRAAMMLVPLETKVEIMLDLQSVASKDGVEVTITPQARVVFGEQFNAPKMGEFLASRIGTRVLGTEDQKAAEAWIDVLLDLKKRLIARGRKAAAS